MSFGQLQQEDEGWYFEDRYGDLSGPYQTKADALTFLFMRIEMLLNETKKELKKCGCSE